MIGVVLWCDEGADKAVFWCEDQGDLAYYERSSHADAPTVKLEAGDMVQFDVNQERRMRRAYNLRLLQESAAEELPAALRNRTAGPSYPSAPNQSAQIIPFAPRIEAAPRMGNAQHLGKA
tara:strand:- start:100625 stop:100984 length:360 start_codon:yes stop_codon:yes gene_type:complete